MHEPLARTEENESARTVLSAKGANVLRVRVALLAFVFAVVGLPNVVAAAVDLLGR